ncbi:MAG: hypothetical protein Q4G64_09440, partial [bacterium]|nr:hypothetical protein [bacterium]
MNVHAPTDPTTTLTARESDARLWLETLPHYPEVRGCFAFALNNGVWKEVPPIRLGVGDLARISDDQGLDALARGIVRSSDEGFDVYACPYPQPRHTRREKAAALARMHAHADIDGPVNMDRARALGLVLVGSGSETDGQPHGHAYALLSRSVDPEHHAALCRGLGKHLGGEKADATKHSDNDVLRIPGTMNYKRGEAQPVRWLIRPDWEGVRTWEPDELAHALGVELKHAEVVENAAAPSAPAPVVNVSARLEGLAREVREAPHGEGNSRLNWA